MEWARKTGAWLRAQWAGLTVGGLLGIVLAVLLALYPTESRVWLEECWSWLRARELRSVILGTLFGLALGLAIGAALTRRRIALEGLRVVIRDAMVHSPSQQGGDGLLRFRLHLIGAESVS